MRIADNTKQYQNATFYFNIFFSFVLYESIISEGDLLLAFFWYFCFKTSLFPLLPDICLDFFFHIYFVKFLFFISLLTSLFLFCAFFSLCICLLTFFASPLFQLLCSFSFYFSDFYVLSLNCFISFLFLSFVLRPFLFRPILHQWPLSSSLSLGFIRSVLLYAILSPPCFYPS